MRRIDRRLMEKLIAERGTPDTPRVYTDRSRLVRELFWRSHEGMLALSRSPRRRALDFGGGNGVLLPTLAEMYDAVTCVDLNTDIAQEVVRLFDLTNVEVVSGDILQLRLPDDHFDTIVAASVFEHVEGLEPLADEMARILTLGGELLANVPSENRLYGLGRRVFGYTKPWDHYYDATFITGVLGRHLRLRERKCFPVNWSPLAVFYLLRFVKEDPEGQGT